MINCDKLMNTIYNLKVKCIVNFDFDLFSKLDSDL